MSLVWVQKAITILNKIEKLFISVPFEKNSAIPLNTLVIDVASSRCHFSDFRLDGLLPPSAAVGDVGNLSIEISWSFFFLSK